ncbi:MAG: ATPase [Treponema sp.]|jgi:hypothetical protein|nr:ATPase [Treponema sp.]
MEELQSTEILDREILEDARKKAQKILKTAEDAIKAKSADWEQKLNAAIGDLEKKYAQQGKFAADEIMARLPLDKRRIKAKKIEELLGSAVETWYTGLSRERVLELLKKELAKRLAASDEFPPAGEIRVRIHKIERKEAERILQALLPGRPCAIEETHSTAVYPQIILETAEVRIYASINKTVEFLLGEKRAELIEALLSRAALLDEEAS